MKCPTLCEAVSLASLGLVALGGCGGPDSDVGEAELGRVSSPIWHGLSVHTTASSPLRERATMRLRATNFRAANGAVGTALCSGTLIRNNVVLTARHCVRKGELLTTYNDPQNVYVYNSFDFNDPPTCNAWNWF